MGNIVLLLHVFIFLIIVKLSRYMKSLLNCPYVKSPIIYLYLIYVIDLSWRESGDNSMILTEKKKL